MREKVQTKLNSMANILIDDIIVPDQQAQQGAESISASYYDKFGNRFTFTLSLAVTPEAHEDVEPAPTLSDQIATILQEIAAIKADVATLSSQVVVSSGNTSEQTGNTNEGNDNQSVEGNNDGD